MPTDSLVEDMPPSDGIAPIWRLLSIVSVILFVLLLFILGSQPIAVGLFPAPWDKLAHLIVFSIIAGLLWISSDGLWPLSVIVLVVAIGAMDEWHQAGLPGRSADFADLMIDAIAAITVVCLLHKGRK